MGSQDGGRGASGRAGALALASVAALAAALLVWVLAPADPAADGDGEVGRAPAAAGAEGAGGRPEALPEGPRQAIGTDADDDPLAIIPLPESDGPELVGVFVEDLAGEPLLRTVPPKIPPALAIAVRVALVPADAGPGSLVPDAGTVPMQQHWVRSEPGWVTAVERPVEPRAVALMFGDAVIAAARIEPGIEAVHLRADPTRFDALSATVRGRLLGFADAAKFVKLLPSRQGRRAVAPVRATGEGDAFELTGIPPGPATLQVRLRPGVFARVQRRADGTSGVLVQSPRRLKDEDQWEGRIETLGRVPLPLHVVALELAPGEERDLGILQPEAAGAAVLRLESGAGEPVTAVNVQVLPLGEPALALEPPDATTFENRMLLHPLPLRPVELFVRTGELGAILEVTGVELDRGAAPIPSACTLRRLGLVVLPGPGAGLSTVEGGPIGSDPRWQGAKYLGVPVDRNVRLVPPGRYVLRRANGVMETIDVAEGQVVRGPGEPEPEPEQEPEKGEER